MITTLAPPFAPPAPIPSLMYRGICYHSLTSPSQALLQGVYRGIKFSVMSSLDSSKFLGQRLYRGITY